MKKLLSVLLIGIMVLMLVACGGEGGKVENPEVEAPKGEKLSMTIEKKGSPTGEMYAVDVYYEPAEAITVESDYENKQFIANTENNVSIEFDLYSDTTYTNNKNAAKEKEDDYKEIKIGDYDGYGYSFSKNTYYVFVRFDGVDEPTMQNCYMRIKVKPTDYNMDTDASLLYEGEYVQNIVKTLTYNGVVTPGAEVAE